MSRTKPSPALAARLLAAHRAEPQALYLELPQFDPWRELAPRDDREDEPDMLVLEADGSFTEVRD